ncbi:hypothetical protein [Polystyrenella longa]|uniref:hypothetical protein n=1 Tax=Polystyrenella longa TaxID=2528007 RepID=UPI0011A7EEDF|nr:hypothetical protein [Polystyrenella longa]
MRHQSVFERSKDVDQELPLVTVSIESNSLSLIEPEKLFENHDPHSPMTLGSTDQLEYEMPPDIGTTDVTLFDRVVEDHY